MQPAQSVTRLPALDCLDEVEQLVRRSLRGNWVIRVEYADTTQPADWQTWGKPLFAVRNSAALVDAILACRASHPMRAIRLNAERFHPDTRLIYWIHQAQQPKPERAHSTGGVPQTDRAVAPVARRNSGAGSARRGLWRLLAIAGMLIASLLVFEGAVFA